LGTAGRLDLDSSLNVIATFDTASSGSRSPPASACFSLLHATNPSDPQRQAFPSGLASLSSSQLLVFKACIAGRSEILRAPTVWRVGLLLEISVLVDLPLRSPLHLRHKSTHYSKPPDNLASRCMAHGRSAQFGRETLRRFVNNHFRQCSCFSSLLCSPLWAPILRWGERLDGLASLSPCFERSPWVFDKGEDGLWIQLLRVHSRLLLYLRLSGLSPRFRHLHVSQSLLIFLIVSPILRFKPYTQLEFGHNRAAGLTKVTSSRRIPGSRPLQRSES